MAAGAAAAFCFLAAKAAEVETAKIARPTRMTFFMLSSLGKRRAAVNHSLWIRVKNWLGGLSGIPGSMRRIAPGMTASTDKELPLLIRMPPRIRRDLDRPCRLMWDLAKRDIHRD